MRKAASFGAICVAAPLLASSVVLGAVKIQLKDGKVVTVPVEKQDVVSITFEETTSPGGIVYVSDLEPASAKSGYPLEKDTFGGDKIKLGFKEYAKGLHSHAPAHIQYKLDGRYSAFESYVGLWDSENPKRGKPHDFAGQKGSVVFKVLLDGREAFNSGVMTWDMTKHVSISVKGVRDMDLIVEDAGDGYGWDWAVWGDAKLVSAAAMAR